MSVARVALVVPGFEEGGGVPAVALFLARIMRASGRYAPSFVSLPMSASDPASVRLGSPASWLRGIRTETDEWEGQSFRRVGARASELEFQRYRPRAELTALLEAFDLVQIVCGSPSWGWVARDLRVPVALQAATLAAVERRELLRDGPALLRGWRSLMTRVTTRLELGALDQVDAIFVENRWMFDWLNARAPSAEVIFAPPGIDTDRFRPSDAGAPPTAAPAPILSVGRFADPRKRAALLFEAYHLLTGMMSDAPPLVLAGGSGPTPADWARAEELGIRERVEFRENVPGDELVSLYRGASLFALASDEEGLGIVLIEAMACGIPVVSTDCGGPSTSVVSGETGYLVERGDARALASKMHAILADDALRSRLGRNARARAVESFSLDAAGRPFLDWYDKALAASRA